MTLERLYINTVVSKNAFDKGGPGGGARGGPCEKAGLEVVIYPPRNVCAKFGVDRVNGHGDIAGRKVSKKCQKCVCERWAWRWR